MRTLLLLAWVALVGCGEGPSPGSVASASNAPRKSPPAADAMCVEHGVLESLCTKCNPKLIPVFQAKGEFCEEHGFPESVCPICHPERGGKPSGSVAAAPDEKGAPPADKTKIRFKTKDIARQAGLETADVALSPTTPSLGVPARIVYDGSKLAHVTVRSAGVVRQLKVDLGAKVKKGDTLAVIESGQVGADRSRIAGATSRVKAAEEEFARKSKLAEEGIATRTSVVEAQKELAEARADAAALSANVAVIGKSGPGLGGYLVEAPIDGVVSKREATVGEMMETNAALFEIVDTSSVWVELDVPEGELHRVSVGQTAAMSFDALAGREPIGKIDFISPSVDPRTRTGKARVSLANPEGLLRANLFGRARLILGEPRGALVVPRAALQRAKGQALVFVKLADDLFEARHVRLGANANETQIAIEEGVKVGEVVVTTGSFLLKTETLKDSIGAGCCEVD